MPHMTWRTLALAGSATLALAVPGLAQGPVPPSPRPDEGSFIYTIDLAAAVPRDPVVVPEGRNLEVGLGNVPLSGTYRVTVSETRRPDRVRPLAPRTSPQLGAGTPPCAALRAELDLALAETDEARLAPRLRSLGPRLAASGCASWEKSTLNYALGLLQPSLHERRLLRPGQTVTYTVERLGEGGAVTRAWHVAFTGGAPDVGWEYPNEETFTVATIAREIADIAGWAAGRRAAPVALRVAPPAPSAALREFQVQAKVRGVTAAAAIRPVPHLWAPAAQAAWAKAVLAALRLRPAPGGPAATDVIERLTDLRASTIEQENARVSARLTRAPLDAAAHEEAALVLAAFAFRERAAEFSDTRPAMARMTAHLALARALGAETGPVGRLAEAALDTLAERQAAALDAIATLQAGDRSPAMAAWTRALAMRNHGDWRVLDQPARATLLERISFFDAASRADSPLRALLHLDERPLERIPDWGRSALSLSVSVDEGHLFADDAVDLELDDLRSVWRVTHERDPERQTLLSDLTLRTGRAAGGGQVRVLEWPDWTAMAARHVCSKVDAVYSFLRYKWGVPERADEFARGADGDFGGLPFYALVRHTRALRARSAGTASDLCDTMNRLVRASPEQVTAGNWDTAFRWCGHTARLPSYATWFSPAVPSGTAYDAARRLLASEIALDLSADAAAALRDIAPYNGNVILAYMGRKYGTTDDPAIALREFGKKAEYQLWAMRRLLAALEKDPPRHRQMLEQMCERSADSCIPLGADLEATDPAAAERAYARAVEQALDRVYVAASVDWLIARYHDTGRPELAMATARMAAATYSHRGLTTMAQYLERLQRFDEAAEYYARIAERYQEPLAVDAFFAKNKDRLDPQRYGARIAEAMGRLFPGGVQKVTLADFTGEPDGAPLAAQTEQVQAWGLQRGHVVVALDGYRLRNHNQYGAIKGWSADPKMRLIVFDGQRYREVEGERARIVYFDTSSSR